jgi:hypothetical protein
MTRKPPERLFEVKCGGCGGFVGMTNAPGVTAWCWSCRVVAPVPVPSESAAKKLRPRQWWTFDDARRAGEDAG